MTLTLGTTLSIQHFNTTRTETDTQAVDSLKARVDVLTAELATVAALAVTAHGMAHACRQAAAAALTKGRRPDLIHN